MSGSAVQSTADTGSRRLMIALYTVVIFLYWTSLYLYVPTLPTYTQSKSDNVALVGVVLSMYGLWQGIIRLPLGIAVGVLMNRLLTVENAPAGARV
jgi:hypothetical protein